MSVRTPPPGSTAVKTGTVRPRGLDGGSGIRRWRTIHFHHQLASRCAPSWGSGKLLAAFQLRQAGAVSAMELDIHKKMVIFILFTPTTPGGAPLGRKLSPAMRGNANRQLVADHRDLSP